MGEKNVSIINESYVDGPTVIFKIHEVCVEREITKHSTKLIERIHMIAIYSVAFLVHLIGDCDHILHNV